MKNNFAYISIVLSFLTGVGLSGIYFTGLEPEVTINETESDVYVNNSQPDVHTTTNVEPPRYNYIQANNHEVDYDFQGGSVEVDSVDYLINLEGLSMRPTFYTGHTLLAKDYENKSLDEGTIVNTKDDIVHRVVGDYTQTEGYYLTRGDNNRGSERVEPSQIDHVVVGVLYSDK